jgi:DNA-binding transcriptional ArsR family regulator
LRPEFWRFSHNKEKTMHLQIDRRPPPIEEVVQRMKARIDRDGIRIENIPSPASHSPTTGNENRRHRSLRSFHLPAEPKPRYTPPRDSEAYVPELAARIEDDRNLTDGARRCARKLAEYIYRKNRTARAGDITVTWLMRALGKSRRTVQRYLRQLEREGYIAVEVVHARTRMCAGLFIALLAPMLPRHHRQEWPQKLMDSDAPRLSQNNKPRYIYSRESWALRCMDGVFRSFMKTHPPLPAIPITI